LRLAIPAAMAMLGLILEDAYASPGLRSPLRLARGPLLGLGFALGSQAVFWAVEPDLAVPRWIFFYGCAMSLLLSTAVRVVCAPVTDRLQGVNAPAHWLKEAGGSAETPPGIIRVFMGIVAILAVAVVGAWITDPAVQKLVLLLVLVIAYQIWKG